MKSNNKINFKTFFDLNTKVSIYVPSTIEVNKQIDNTVYCKEVQNKLSLLFGGATTQDVLGSYICEDGSQVNEIISIVYSFCSTEQLKNNIFEVINICEYLKKEMTQESILLEVNGKVKFI